jgi:hypothetical protein
MWLNQVYLVRRTHMCNIVHIRPSAEADYVASQRHTTSGSSRRAQDKSCLCSQSRYKSQHAAQSRTSDMYIRSTKHINGLSSRLRRSMCMLYAAGMNKMHISFGRQNNHTFYSIQARIKHQRFDAIKQAKLATSGILNSLYTNIHILYTIIY